VGFLLSCPNIYGYLKCAKDSRSKLKSIAKNYAEQTAKDYAQQAATNAVKDYAKNFSVKSFFSGGGDSKQ